MNRRKFVAAAASAALAGPMALASVKSGAAPPAMMSDLLRALIDSHRSDEMVRKASIAFEQTGPLILGDRLWFDFDSPYQAKQSREIFGRLRQLSEEDQKSERALLRNGFKLASHTPVPAGSLS